MRVTKKEMWGFFALTSLWSLKEEETINKSDVNIPGASTLEAGQNGFRALPDQFL
jgi:hypothetical protein